MRRMESSWFILVCFGLLVGGAQSRGEDAPAQGAALIKTDLLGVFAHPDDETGVAATMAGYALGQRKVVSHVYATRGEGGGNMVGTQSGPALGILREAELRRCLSVLGVQYCFFLDQTDFFYTESSGATLRKWDYPDALRRLVRLVRALRPEVIVTMNPAPNPGQHGHHQTAGILATEAFVAAADPTRYPEQLADEGLTVWQPRKLFYGGAQGKDVVTITTTTPLPDGRVPADAAALALSEHRSQAFGGMVRSPWLRRPQVFTLVKSAVPPAAGETDLFGGLPISEPVTLFDFPKPGTRPELVFRPRPAIARYLDWARQQDIDHLTSAFPADVPLVAGEENVVVLEVAPRSLEQVKRSLKLELPVGWRQGRPRLLDGARSNDAADTRLLAVDLELPDADAPADEQIVAEAQTADGQVQATARAHVVPRARIPGTRRGPRLGQDTQLWDTAARLVIGTNRIWQGRVDSPSDCSAEARLLHDGRRLYVQVTVRDEQVVSNIEPNDIRGHWRSDSVEICVDPAAGAEDTTGCFKIGIFPFDTTGQVRAARDADANQGPVEMTAPGLEVKSERTSDGYRIEASIPYDVLVARGKFPSRLGFNVLIYDGDKTDAAPGENINECRLAWSPRAGVQGRPEDWGRVELE